ncbi:hypothetical protein P171DRAFT_185967 [Karstenula rhodostoma CBS 690.94]|uniref:Uncharacterized protein n=1 Tax=Karstenula rhodostoma CBS 690.94 TaxID=1392251 RepID=A0A9P4PRH8_9PLEO|nr:hypothetical protein P171DRAFT_185967 [Karstenula rhodostoma CBS 690.94]
MLVLLRWLCQHLFCRQPKSIRPSPRRLSYLYPLDLVAAVLLWCPAMSLTAQARAPTPVSPMTSRAGTATLSYSTATATAQPAI